MREQLLVWLTLGAALAQLSAARLIHIYTNVHKPPSAASTNEDPVAEALANATMAQLQAESSSQLEQLASQRSIEFTSPMKRIMELIGNHAPIIVVSSSASSAESNGGGSSAANDADQSPTASASANSAQSNPMVHMVAPHTSASNIDHQHQWALLDPNQMMQLTGQQQQLYQTNIPYEQYYLADPNQLAGAQTAGQMAMLPAFYGLPEQQLAQQMHQQQVLPHHHHHHHQQQQQQQLPNQNGLEDRVQPIFLSSYVPEISAQTGKPGAGPVPALLMPNSIQQIQQAARSASEPPVAVKSDPPTAPPSASKPAEPKESEGKQDGPADSAGEPDGPDGEPPDEVPDIEEPSKTRRSSAGQDAQEAEGPGGDGPNDNELPGGSGSVSYEDKYDSDKDDQPNISDSRRVSQKQAAASSPANSLVAVGLNDDCLQCICRASSGCDHHLRCITRGADEKYCGPFQLTEDYWQAAGSPGDANNNFQSFEECANEPDCAVETVTSYMKKYHTDCDGDDNITCLDYARLHRLKPSECANTDKLAAGFDSYWAKFQLCAEGYNRSRNGDDEDI